MKQVANVRLSRALRSRFPCLIGQKKAPRRIPGGATCSADYRIYSVSRVIVRYRLNERLVKNRLAATADPGERLAATAVFDISHDKHLHFGLLLTHP